MKIQVGDKYGRWTVLQVKVKNPSSKAKNPPYMAYCKCDCGKEQYVEYRALYEGRSLSCGCLRSDIVREKNLNNSSVKIGNIYGFLEVKENLGLRKQTRGSNETWYRCLCQNCGNDNFEVSGNNLQSGATKSCGCICSWGETLIGQWLRRNNINYATQYTFKDLVSKRGYCLKFDFAIFKNNNLYGLIEYDGRQHTLGPEGKWNYSLEEIQYNDNLKNQYCISHNIKLLRISYTDKDNINNILNDFVEIGGDYVE